MHDLRDYKTLSARQLTTAISQLNHNTAPKIMTHLALRARQPQPLGNGRSRAKALKLLRRVKKAHKAGCIPFELTVTGCRIDRGSHQADRYYYDRTLLAQGWQQYDTEEDAWYFGIWIHTEKLETFTYAEGDTSHVIAPNVEAFRAELARLYQYYPQAPAFISFDPEAGVVTHHFEAKPEVCMAKNITIRVPGKHPQTGELTTFELKGQRMDINIGGQAVHFIIHGRGIGTSLTHIPSGYRIALLGGWLTVRYTIPENKPSRAACAQMSIDRLVAQYGSLHLLDRLNCKPVINQM